LRDLAAALPSPEPAPLDLRRLRARVLRDVELKNPEPARWRIRAAIGLSIAFCAIAFFVIRHRHAASLTPPALASAVASSASPATTNAAIHDDAFAGEVIASADARWSHTRDDGVEHVRLDDGILSLHVRHQGSSEHFFVDLPDGQIEVRGTTFRVEVHDGVTTRIDVSEGVVSVRLRGADEIWVSAGQSWTRPPSVASAASVAKASAPNNAPTPKLASSDESGTDEYASAVTMMRNGSYDAAATAFSGFLAAHPNASQAEDASFLEAAALARAGRSDAAALAAEHHLAAYPHSFHGKEAAILVARAARDRGDCAKARAVLTPWLGTTPDAEAQATLRSCASP
jgi:mannose-6-phosphate isomerase-like protein (cupin superfamily)